MAEKMVVHGVVEVMANGLVMQADALKSIAESGDAAPEAALELELKSEVLREAARRLRSNGDEADDWRVRALAAEAKVLELQTSLDDYLEDLK